jgi:gliding motility-associatede transport system auxiliary component
MAHPEPSELVHLLWFAGWCVAMLVLFGLGTRLPLQRRLSHWMGMAYTAGSVAAAMVVTVLANVALVGHDVHFDLTRERVFTPSRQALEVVDRLSQDVALTYFYHAQDPNGKRLKELMAVLGRRNPRLHVRTIDPDSQPSLAHTYGVRLYNAAVLEAEGRRLVVHSTDENDIAIGIQRVVRERVMTLCFIEGHNEYPIDNFEFHTHLEGLHDHSHGDATSKVVQMPGHGIGRLRRALEALGFEVRTILPATEPEIPRACAVVIDANPRTTYWPSESAALEAYLTRGGSLLLLYDLGFVIEPRLAQMLAKLGVRCTQSVVIDPQQHYATDPEMVAVSGLEPHPITTNVSLTFFPGARALELLLTASGITAVPLIRSSKASYTRPVEPVETRQVGLETLPVPATANPSGPQPQPHILAVAVEGSWTTMIPDTRPFRVVVVGDADFASNSFFPYMANSDLLLSMVRWLVREERAPGVASRIPVPALILLTRPQMRQIFLVTEVLLPLSILIIGACIWWKRR